MSSPHNTIVVTGGSTGIGLCICLSLLNANYNVINLSRRKAEIDNECFSNIQIDLSSREETSEAAKKIAAEHEVTGFVHNAGLIRPALLGDVQLDDFDYLAQVHIGTAISLTQAFLPTMKKNTCQKPLFFKSCLRIWRISGQDLGPPTTCNFYRNLLENGCKKISP